MRTFLVKYPEAREPQRVSSGPCFFIPLLGVRIATTLAAEFGALAGRCHRLLSLFPPPLAQPWPQQQLGSRCASLRLPTVTRSSEAVNSKASGANKPAASANSLGKPGRPRCCLTVVGIRNWGSKK